MIERLFVQGHRLKSPPFLLIYEAVAHQGPHPIKVGFSVPKKNIRSAVLRNRIKRLMREAYRINEPKDLSAIPQQYILMLLYMPSEELEYAKIEKGIVTLMKTFLTKIGNRETET